MHLNELIVFLTQDKMALGVYFLLIPVCTLLLSKVAIGAKAEEAPYRYLYSILIYAICIPGVFSGTIWGYSMFFEQHALTDLNIFVYYLPLAAMLGTIGLLYKKVSIRALPWFGELYELLLLIAIAFGTLLLLMKSELVPFSALWQLLVFFMAFFSILKLGWERFVKLTR